MSMNNKGLKVGIAGYGLVGRQRRVFIDNNQSMETVAVCDVRFKSDARMEGSDSVRDDYEDLEKIACDKPFIGKMKDGVLYTDNYRLLLEELSLDVLFVCVPTYVAAEITIAGLEKGLHVFCEKPPACTLEEMKRIVDVEKKYPDLKLKYGFNHRYHDSVIEAKDIIDSGRYGELMSLRGVYGKSRMIPLLGGWRSKKAYAGGGILLDQGIHMMDMIRYFSGEYEEVKSFITNDFWKHDVEDNAYIIMRNKEGQVAMMHSTATQWQHIFRLELVLKGALLELSGIVTNSKSYGEEKLKVVPRVEGSYKGSHRESVYLYMEDHSWGREVNEFANIIIENKPVLNGNSLDALKVMELIERVYAADEQWVKKNI